LAIAISLAVHIGAIAAAITLPYLLSQRDLPGPGEEVQVWLAEPSGDIAYGVRHGALKRSTKRSQADTEGMTLGKREAIPEENDEEVSQRAGGTGGVGGPGISKDSGGSELLAKIWRRINASKYYPASARRSGITGSPRVAFALDENGQVRWVKLVASSGKRILDDAAVETVRRAAPLPYYPKPITVAVRYSLNR
jgi:TonB family protein